MVHQGRTARFGACLPARAERARDAAAQAALKRGASLR